MMPGRATPQVITLTTDFGRKDHYAGVLHGVILSISPSATVVDLCHDVPPQDVRAGAFILMAACRYFPAGTIHVAIVDPGVGTARRILAARAGGHVFIGPDNGLLRWALDRAGGAEQIVSVEHPRYRLAEVSATFHGRDVMAPAAGHLANGVPLADLGPAVVDPAGEPFPQPERRGDLLLGTVIYVDRFGNCVTNLPAPERPVAQVGAAGQALPFCRAYAEAARGAPLALVGSAGLVEIAVNGGSAASELGLTVGAPVTMELSP
jgi:S-adenosylmethionine hydrolase